MGLKSLVKSGLSGIGGWLNDITGVSDTAKQSMKASQALMAEENANNIALWNMQNEYNTPAAQIARMKDAGIDVNPMIYAVGNGNMSTTASSVSTASPHMPNYSTAGNPITTLVSVLNGLSDVETKNLNNRILRKDVQVYEDTGIRPSSDGWSQLARFLESHFPGFGTSTIGKIGKVAVDTYEYLDSMVDKFNKGKAKAAERMRQGKVPFDGFD